MPQSVALTTSGPQAFSHSFQRSYGSLSRGRAELTLLMAFVAAPAARAKIATETSDCARRCAHAERLSSHIRGAPSSPNFKLLGTFTLWGRRALPRLKFRLQTCLRAPSSLKHVCRLVQHLHAHLPPPNFLGSGRGEGEEGREEESAED